MKIWAVVVGSLAMVTPACAAEGLDGAHLSLLWALPFAGILLSIALGPLLFHRWWHPHYAKVAAFFAFLTVFPMLVLFGTHTTVAALFHTFAGEYAPFILMLLALFTSAGGLVVRGAPAATPLVNTGVLAIGTLAASIIGTTGASLVLLRPLLRANAGRRNNAHVFIFFIFLVANIGGALTPLGDPPLFLGFLRGIDFFWTTRALAAPMLLSAAVLLTVFFVLDTIVTQRDPAPATVESDGRLRISGIVNLFLIGIIVGAIVISGVWKPGIEATVLGTRVELQNVLRELVMVGVTFASLRLTDTQERAANGFNWEPIREVAQLFAAIFICIIPVMAMLQAGTRGPFAALISLVALPDGSPNNDAYFWLTGLLSSLLDNAPTYLVFFQLAGGDPATLMGSLAGTLTAISMGAVFMGALTYIGNAPNFMIYAIARDSGVRMPDFFGYIVWSVSILVPVFALGAWIFVD